MKSELKARPVYLSRKDRILAHFQTCFIALIIFKVLESKLHHKFSAQEIISTLREMDMQFNAGYGYIPIYTRTELTALPGEPSLPSSGLPFKGSFVAPAC